MKWLVGISLAVASLAVPAAAGGVEIRFVDDRGQPIPEALEVCLVSGLDTTCREVEAGEPLAGVEAFDSIRAESAHYGPVHTERRLLVREDEALTLTVARKARLRVTGRADGDPLTLSLYDVDDRTFRRPAHRFGSADLASRELHIPAGEHVASLSSPGRAPDLHRLSAPPGETVAIEYRPRQGWSLVLRATGEEAEAPVAGVRVAIGPAAGYGSGSTGPTAVTDHAGIALISGLPFPLAQASLRHPDHLDGQVFGLTSTPGSFVYQEAELARGGSLRARVTLDGEPAPGLRCEVRPPAAAPTGTAEPEPEATAVGAADARGICGFDRLAPGRWLLVVEPEISAPATFSHLAGFWIEDGQETELAVDLEPIAIEGLVLRGDEPVPDYRIVVLSRSAEGALEELGEAISGEEGEYRAVVWAPGEYFVNLRTPDGGPGAFERLWVGSGGAEHDFELSPAGLEGVVVDDAGRGLSGASVVVRWGRSRTWSARADDQGRFAFDLEAGGGDAELTASRPGYDLVEPVAVTVPPDGSAAPVVLVLRRNDDLRGTLLAADGSPLGGALVTAYQSAPGPWPVERGSTVTDVDGRFVVPRATAGPSRLWVTGPGCPLRASDVAADHPRDQELTVACPDAPANLVLHLAAPDGAPLTGKVLTLRHGAVLVPAAVLRAHLGSLGLPAATDGAGRAALVALEPGSWDLYLEEASNPETIAAGLPHGFLAAVDLAPLVTRELEVTVGAGP